MNAQFTHQRMFRPGRENTAAEHQFLLLHASSSSHRQWRTLTPWLAGEGRIDAPDLFGYGASQWSASDTLTATPDVDIRCLSQRIARFHQPLHIIGHSYGGLLALELARRWPERVASLLVYEPVVCHLHRQWQRLDWWSESLTLASEVRHLVAQGRAQKAATRYMGHWIGRMRWTCAPRALRRAVISSMPKVALEFGLLEMLADARSDYRALSMPVTLVHGTCTRPSMRSLCAGLQRSLRHARSVALQGVGHLGPISHPETFNRAVMAHVQRVCGADPVKETRSLVTVDGAENPPVGAP